MEQSDQTLTFLLLASDGKPIARIITNEKELASSDSLKNESQNELLYDCQSLEEGIIVKKEQSTVVESGSNIKTEIRSILRNFCFMNFSQNQASSTLLITLKPPKTVFVKHKKESYRFQIFSGDTGYTLLERLSSSLKTKDLKYGLMICIYSIKTSPWEVKLCISDLFLNIWNLIDEDCHSIKIGYGNQYGPISIAKELKVIFHNGRTANYLYFDEELVESFLDRIGYGSLFDTAILGDISDKQKANNESLMEFVMMGDCGVEQLIISVFWNPLMLKQRNHPISLAFDLSSPCTKTGRGVVSNIKWECFNEGFNILGNCTRVKCPSKGKEVVVNLKYPKYFVLTEGKNTYICPACEHPDEPISIKTFLVSSARAKFRFTKADQQNLEETFVLETSSGEYGDYALFEETEEKSGNNKIKIDYDFIEVTTVKFGYSFNSCQLCNQDITLSEEIILECGRAFHKACSNNGQFCPVCRLPEYKLDALPGSIESQNGGFARISLSNQMFRLCKNGELDNTANKVVAKPISCFVKAVSSRQVEDSKNSGAFKLELQESFVIENLPELIRLTSVNTLVLAELRKLKILSEEDECLLNSLTNRVDKSRELYRMIPRRINAISSLITVLDRECQSGAVVVLSKFYKYKYER